MILKIKTKNERWFVMKISNISTQNNRLSFGGISLQRGGQRTIKSGIDVVLKDYSLPHKPIQKVLNGPPGHPYTGRTIINTHTELPDESLIGKLKKTKEILFDKDNKVTDTDTLDDASDLVKETGKTVKDFVEDIFDLFF